MINEKNTTSADDLEDLFRRAAQVLVTSDTKSRYPTWADAIDADPIEPTLPTTRANAIPNILLVAPFQDDAELVAVAIYIGIGLIRVSDVDGHNHAYQTSVIDGAGKESRIAYLDVALRLYFHDVTFREGAKA